MPSLADVPTIDLATEHALLRGVRQFQASLSAPTELGHAANLLGMMNPVPGALVIDAGCGIGETARLMRTIRNDLNFVLINISAQQLERAPRDMLRFHTDFTAMPRYLEGSADWVMYLHAATQHEDWNAVLGEARRVLRPNGRVLIVDLCDVGGADRAAWRAAGCDLRSPTEWASRAAEAGFVATLTLPMPCKVDQLKLLLGEGPEYERMSRGVAVYAVTLKPVFEPEDRP